MFIPSRLVREPPLLPAPAPGHPLTQGLFSAWMPGALPAEANGSLIRNMAARGEALLRTGPSGTGLPTNQGWYAGILGQQLYCSFIQGIAWRTDRIRWKPQAAGGYTPVTIAYYGDSGLTTGLGDILYSLSSSAASSGLPRISFYVNGNSLGNYNLRGEVALSGGGAAVLSGRAVAPYVPFRAILTTRTATDHEIGFRDERTSPSFGTSSAGAGSAANEITHEALGASWGSSGPQFRHAAGVYAAFAWDRALSRSEMTAWLHDPFCMFRAPRRLFSAALSAVTGELDATIEDCALESSVSVPVVGAVDATIEDAALDAFAFMPVNGTLAATVDDLVLTSAAAQVGDGTLALFDATIEDCELEADASVLVASGLDATIEDCVLSGLGVVGSLGPFTRRPFLVLN